LGGGEGCGRGDGGADAVDEEVAEGCGAAGTEVAGDEAGHAAGIEGVGGGEDGRAVDEAGEEGAGHLKLEVAPDAAGGGGGGAAGEQLAGAGVPPLGGGIEGALAIGAEAEVVGLGHGAVAAADEVHAAHDAGPAAGGHGEVGADFVIGPALVAEDGVGHPFGRPALRGDGHDLLEAEAGFIRTRGDLKDAGDVGGIMRQVTPLGGPGVFSKGLVIREGEGLGGGDIVEGAFLLAGGGGEGIDRVRLECQGERAIHGVKVGLLDELAGGIAAPDAEGVRGEAAGDVECNRLRGGGVLSFGDDAVIMVGRLEGDEGATAGEVAATAIQVVPADLGELAVVGVAPHDFAGMIIAAPWGIGDEHSGGLRVGFHGIYGADEIPVHDFGDAADEEVLVEGLDEADLAVEALFVHMLLGIPDGLVIFISELADVRRSRAGGHGVVAEDGDGVAQGLVVGHVAHPVEFGLVPVIEAVDEDVLEAVGIQGGAEFFDEVLVDALFIAATDGIELQAVDGFEALDPAGVIIAHVLGPEIAIADPGGATPGAGIEGERGVAFFGLAHEPPFVAAPVIKVVAGVHVAGLGALGGVAIARHLDEEGAEGGAELGFEEEVEDLVALGLGIIFEQHGGGAAATDGADAVEAFAAGITAEVEGLVRAGGEEQAGDEGEQEQVTHKLCEALRKHSEFRKSTFWKSRNELGVTNLLQFTARAVMGLGLKSNPTGYENENSPFI